jgi:predicted tellurium resistance membrane protein TerC
MPEFPNLENLLTLQNLIALLTLTGLEVVLGIDNIIFIAILASRLKPEQRDAARYLGITLAVVTRILLLLSITWVMSLEATLFTVYGHAVSGKDLILILGGVFLIGKSTYEIHHRVQGTHDDPATAAGRVYASLFWVVLQIVLVDMVFSLDSVLTAVGLTKAVPIMIAAILASVVVMLAFSGLVVRFVERHPTILILALAFLLLIGVLLVAEGFGQHIDRGYVYFAMAFSLGVELLQMRAEGQAKKRVAHPGA